MSVAPKDALQRPQMPARATDAGLGSLPLGSAQSRAAARLLLQTRRKSERHRDLILTFADVDGCTTTQESGPGDDGIQKTERMQ
jgi:hypothetical protein